MAGSSGGGKTRRTGASAKRAKASRGRAPVKATRKVTGVRSKATNSKRVGRGKTATKKRSAR